MSSESCYSLEFAKKLLKPYSLGDSCWQICKTFMISESMFYTVINKYPKLKTAARNKRNRNLLKKKIEMVKKSKKPKVKLEKLKKEKLSPEEKIKQLEKLLKQEQSKNKEMTTLLEIAKEELGKY